MSSLIGYEPCILLIVRGPKLLLDPRVEHITPTSDWVSTRMIRVVMMVGGT
jgi:hypothetical protein